MKTSELTGAALNWAVAKADDLPININPGHGFFVKHPDGWEYFTPSIDWAQGGPIIEREHVNCGPQTYGPGTVILGAWWAVIGYDTDYGQHCHEEYGPTPLTAAMRCYVVSKLGDEIEIPKELKNG